MRRCLGAVVRARSVRRSAAAVDLEDWSAFHDSYLRLMDLLRDVATPGEPPAPDPPATITILSGRRPLQLPRPGDVPRRAGRARRPSAASIRS